MADARALLTDYSTELARTATVSLSVGSADTGYGVERLTDGEPDYVFRSPDDQVAILFDFGVQTPVRYLFQIHGTPESTDDVRVQANATDVWTAPSVDEPFPQAGWLGAGASRWPLNPWLDLHTLPGWDTAGYRYVRLAYGLTTPLTQPLQLGQILMYASARAFYLERGAQPRPTRPAITHQTAVGRRTVYPYGTALFGMDFTLGGLEAADLASLEAQWHDVDSLAQPFAFVPDGLVNRCYMVRWAAPRLDLTSELSTLSTARVGVEELARGLRPGT